MNHMALEADSLIPEEILQGMYGKGPERQVSEMLGVKQPTPAVAAALLKHGVAAERFHHARFLKLTRNPPVYPAISKASRAAASEAAKIAEDAAKAAREAA